MPIVWPATLPQVPLFGWGRELADTRLRTETDTGPVKMRRQYTSGVEKLSNVVINLDETQRTALETFFYDTTAGGSLAFEWQLPDTGATRNFRFVDPPTFSAINHQSYRASMNLEVMPA